VPGFLRLAEQSAARSSRSPNIHQFPPEAELTASRKALPDYQTSPRVNAVAMAAAVGPRAVDPAHLSGPGPAWRRAYTTPARPDPDEVAQHVLAELLDNEPRFGPAHLVLVGGWGDLRSARSRDRVGGCRQVTRRGGGVPAPGWSGAWQNRYAAWPAVVRS
jgi:hypothetical protein